MKTAFTYFIITGIAAGVIVGITEKNIAAGIMCCVAIADLPVLFFKRKIRTQAKSIKP